MRSLPPSKEALHQHVLWASYKLDIYGGSLLKNYRFPILNNGVGSWTQWKFISNHYGQLLIHQLQLKTLLRYVLARQESAKLANVRVIIYHVFLCVAVVDLGKDDFLSLCTGIVLWLCCLILNVKKTQISPLQIDKIIVYKLPLVPEFCIFYSKYEMQKIQYRCSS